MAQLIVHGPNLEETKFTIFKRLTSIGSGLDADIKINSEKIDNTAAYISRSARGFTLLAAKENNKLMVNGQATDRHELQEQDAFTLGDINLRFHSCDGSLDNDPILERSSAITAYRRLLHFSQNIAQEKDVEALLVKLLKEITQLVEAEHGFLVLLEDGNPRIKVQEPEPKPGSPTFISPISDSIVKKVIESKDAIVLNDALNDQEFSSSLSVINYRLTSVMCVPLTYQGKTFGAIYVGNNSLVSAFDNKSLEIMTIYASQAAVLVQNALHINALKKHTQQLQESLDLTKFGGIIGGCQKMQELFQQVGKVADSDINVLINGETGTGKELIAKELHNRSRKKEGPFVAINCGAIPEELLESELFGHVRGAFPEATQTRIGKFQAANYGTLFLNEIDKIPLYLQAKLLKALQEQAIVKRGDRKYEKVDVRVIAASCTDMTTLIKNGQFRDDLHYRLNVVNLIIPPLRERGNDVLVIANFFIQKYAKVYGKEIIGLLEEAQNTLLNYSWPGNVRQLENRIRRAIVMCDSQRISTEDLDIDINAYKKVITLADAIDRYRTRYINEALERNAYNRTKTANELGVDPRTIFRHLESAKKVETSSHSDGIE